MVSVPCSGATLKYVSPGGIGTQGSWPAVADAADQERWTAKPLSVAVSRVSTAAQTSATSGPKAAQTMSVTWNAGAFSGDGSVAASTSSWLAATVVAASVLEQRGITAYAT